MFPRRNEIRVVNYREELLIKNIEKLQNLGIFRQYSKDDVPDFSKFNLLYGWNGSGKTTLATLFHSLEDKTLPNPDKFPNPEFKISLTDGQLITHENLSDITDNVRVFDEDFVESHINWDEYAKSILLISEEKIADIEKLNKLKSESQTLAEIQKTEKGQITNLLNENKKFLSNAAKNIKVQFQTLDTSDTYYFNYNRDKLFSFINKNKSNIQNLDSELNEEKRLEVTQAAKPLFLPKIETKFNPVDSDKLIEAKSRLDDLLKTKITTKTIQRLLDKPDIQSWVLTGKELHKTHDSDQCEFCGNTISHERLEEIENHFSNEFELFKEKLQKADQWLSGRYIEYNDLPTESSLYEELREEYLANKAKLINSTNEINQIIKNWHENLTSKTENPFNTDLLINDVNEELITSHNKLIEKLGSIIKSHNDKSDNFAEVTKTNKEILELHYTTTQINQYDYFTKLETFDKIQADSSNRAKEILAFETEIKKIEDSLSNETIGADEFNDSLHKFLGREDISLVFNKDLGGYEIIRNNSGNHTKYLSQGEKTAIAFIYFIIKLKEQGNKIDDTIAVIDDPVSSFDSNCLLHASLYLRQHCSIAKQVFVFTHNFNFFKMVKEWMGEERIQENSNTKPEGCFNPYAIETTSSSPRSANIVKAHESLVKYDSEYHYLFCRLYQLKDSKTPSIDEHYLTANLSRRLLESILDFKFPKKSKRSTLKKKMEQGINDKTLSDKVYFYINKYSHSLPALMNEDYSDHVMAESSNIVEDVFKCIENIDSEHLKSMKEISEL